ncbi:drug resistance transporter, EmrB/QacA subfamily [Paludibacter propionicigenes WB4]|uniref:Drug resistance transporter, EmrB/QacA subfamily n=1 Tax=Paludibacter propionicigenes (strain DSM 17365 / JCM 13257 / WB4) TaxID=694427 RepID=E4T144_PALPW|nr:DHA2 family efflux MFS transporter permease subunit [Paludibacter propionicigenes]ADQ78425.1 drug resistance transporter, EmrB/QacA subfamily [Paludibacter propionicigenes WB4]
MRKISNTHRLRRKLRSNSSIYHPKSPTYKWFVLANIMVGTFMVVLDSTIVNVSLPKIMSSFGVGLSTIQWVITAYMLSMAAMLPTSGWLADKFGYKRVYFWGLFLFTLGSLLCGLSNDESTLIISRVIQGIGAGTVQPLGMAIITREFPLKQRGVALGFWAIAAAASVSFGPLIGGYLVDNFSWQLIFDVNVPVGILALLFTILIQREFVSKNARKFDYIGFISVIIFLPVLLYALSEGNAQTNSAGWTAPYILACFAISGIAFTVFLTRELTTKYPLLDLRLLKDRNFAMSNLLMFVFSIGMFGSTFLLPLFLQNSLGYTALQSGAVFLPVGIIQGLFSPISGWFSDKVNPKVPIIAGVGLLVVSFFLNSELSLFTEHDYIMTSLYLRGLGMGLIFTPLSTLSLLTIPREKMAQASGIMNTIRQIGGSLGVALLSTILTARVNFHAQMYGGSVLSGSESFKTITKNMAYYIQQHGGGSFSTALKQGQSLLMSNVSSQAYIQGINDDFLIAAFISILGFIPILLLKSKKKGSAPIESEHVAMME